MLLRVFYENGKKRYKDVLTGEVLPSWLTRDSETIEELTRINERLHREIYSLRRRLSEYEDVY